MNIFYLFIKYKVGNPMVMYLYHNIKYMICNFKIAICRKKYLVNDYF